MSNAKNNSEILRRDRDRFLAFSFAAADTLLEIDRDWTITFAVGAVQSFFGLHDKDVLGKNFLNFLKEGDRILVRSRIARLRDGVRLEPIFIRLNSYDHGALLMSGCRLPHMGDKLFIAISKTGDVTHEKGGKSRRGGDELQNEQEFITSSIKALQQARTAGEDVDMTFFDLGQMDELAERAGRERVETFRKGLAAFLSAQSIGGSTAGQIAEGRYGFVHMAGVDISSIHEDIDNLAREIDPEGTGVEIREATIDLDSDEISDADLERAIAFTIHQFAEKGASGIGMHSIEDGLNSLMNETLKRVSALKKLVSQRNFGIVFQPIVDMNDFSVHHYEVLSRFAPGQSPAETIAFAEEVGLIADFDIAVCEQAIQRLASFKQPDIHLAVNLSGASLESDLFVRELLTTLNQLGSQRSSIILEITETAEIADLERAERIIQTLRGNGHPVCLDDFGAGAASFQYFQALTVDFVKIDGAYVRRVLENRRDAAILRAIAGLCCNLGIKTVAEMIETSRQARLLKGFGIDLGQGWLFGRPENDPVALSPTGYAAQQAG